MLPPDAGVDHPTARFSRHKPCPLEIRVQYEIPSFLIDIDRLSPIDNAGVICNDVDGSERVFRAVEGGLYTAGVADIHLNGQRHAAFRFNLFRECFEAIEPASSYYNSRAMFGQQPR